MNTVSYSILFPPCYTHLYITVILYNYNYILVPVKGVTCVWSLNCSYNNYFSLGYFVLQNLIYLKYAKGIMIA